jgi:hypothetical protein
MDGAITAYDRDASAADRRTFANYFSSCAGESLTIELPPDVTSLADLGESIVRFGKTYVGKSYRETLHSGGDRYAKWLHTRVFGTTPLGDESGRFRDFLVYASCALSLHAYEQRVTSDPTTPMSQAVHASRVGTVAKSGAVLHVRERVSHTVGTFVKSATVSHATGSSSRGPRTVGSSNDGM